MTSIALFIAHKVKPGQREAVKALWLQHMAPAIQANSAHLSYVYGFDTNDDDGIAAFQHYESAAAAQDFLVHPAYLGYLAAVEPLLADPPKITTLSPQWVKRPEPYGSSSVSQ